VNAGGSIPASCPWLLAALGAWFLLPGSIRAAERSAPCRIDVVEAGSRWPVPGIELRTMHQVRFVTDNAGVIALDLPELMGRETWFDVVGHGYERPKDGFGYRGVRLTPQPGGHLAVEVQRTAVARRLGRLTGAGRFGESRKLGLGPANDGFESGVLGSDRVQTAVHRGRLYWLWGDTTLARYPLGIFDCSSATTPVRALTSFEPPLRFRLDYFTNAQGTVRGVAPIPGKGPTWLSAYVSLPDAAGTPRLVATYAKIEPPLEAYEWGLCAWNEAKQVFEPLRVIWKKTEGGPTAPPHPDGHPAFWKDDRGREWVLFGNPLPMLRCPATFEAWQDPAHWEVLTPQASLAAADGGGAVKPHSGSIAWHPWRRRWVTVFMQAFGKPSAFGEIWYAEAPAPTGPWGPAVKVLSHENYTFYNPRLHPEFTPEGSPLLFFEGTFSMMFADHAAPVPRHDYNQVLYRLDLDDPALKPAQIVMP
jgi:hypothetical protein